MRSRLLRNIRLGVKDLLLHKLRSLLTTLGVVFGVGSVIAMLAVGEGASQQAMAQIRKLGSHNIIISSEKPADDNNSTAQRSYMSIYGLLYADEERIRASMPFVSRTVPVRLAPQKGGLGEQRMDIRVVGTTPDWFDLVSRPVVAGRVLRADDVRQLANVCVLTEAGARRLLAGRHAIGETLRVGDQVFQVVGIVRTDTGGEGIQLPDQDADAYIPLNVYNARFGEITVKRSTGSSQMELVELHQILVEVADLAMVEAAAAAIEAMLKQAHRKEDYRVHVPLALLKQAEQTKRTFNIVLGSIAGISLLVGGIGIMNIMLASVTERTREIGIRRAIGARRGQIVAQFLVETVVLSAVGGFIGILVGIAFPWAITRLSNLPTVIPLYAIVLSLGISMAIGLVFGLYPAVRAANLDPIEALRHE
jgi:putative ABC transport system permease protein